MAAAPRRKVTVGLAAQIALNLAAQRSIADAEQFIARFEGSKDYPQLLESVISGIAQSDVPAAIQMASRVPASHERDSLYSGLIGQYAQQDPQQAAALLGSITDDGQRARAFGMLAMVWSHVDTAAAEDWARELPRDDAIMHLTGNWEEMTPSRQLLVMSIDNAEKRKEALVMHIHRVAQTDPQQAERLAQDIDLTDEEWRQLQDAISMMRTYQ